MARSLENRGIKFHKSTRGGEGRDREYPGIVSTGTLRDSLSRGTFLAAVERINHLSGAVLFSCRSDFFSFSLSLSLSLFFVIRGNNCPPGSVQFVLSARESKSSKTCPPRRDKRGRSENFVATLPRFKSRSLPSPSSRNGNNSPVVRSRASRRE